ncbi:MAG: hypothetical protein WC773_01705 [Patescibacteria group bacterium]|jgi:hypothetical protein
MNKNISSNTITLHPHWLGLVTAVLRSIIKIASIVLILLVVNNLLVSNPNLAGIIFVIALAFVCLDLYNLMQYYWRWLNSLLIFDQDKFEINLVRKWQIVRFAVDKLQIEKMTIRYPSKLHQRVNLGVMHLMMAGNVITFPLMRFDSSVSLNREWNEPAERPVRILSQISPTRSLEPAPRVEMTMVKGRDETDQSWFDQISQKPIKYIPERVERQVSKKNNATSDPIELIEGQVVYLR